MAVPRRDKRKSSRIPVCMPATFQSMSGKTVLSQKHQGEVLDISYHGLLLQTKTEFSQAAEIQMSLTLDLFSDRITDVYARIIRTKEPDGKFHSSLEFTAIGTDGQNTIRRYIDHLTERS
ncbi:MAG: PilZ domain-containing protein [Gammaproteobacteria bacterium]|jgi:hypothetical protein|nr:PilZ domain-containing protein [Gammaproteobacteria bacterium]|tara:strand:+ start:142 stop:501 length:360 start_codon:yes stop_codon:yes gene_type:complete